MTKEQKNEVLGKAIHEMDEATDILMGAIATAVKEGDYDKAHCFSDYLKAVLSVGKEMAIDKEYM